MFQNGIEDKQIGMEGVIISLMSCELINNAMCYFYLLILVL